MCRPLPTSLPVCHGGAFGHLGWEMSLIWKPKGDATPTYVWTVDGSACRIVFQATPHAHSWQDQVVCEPFLLMHGQAVCCHHRSKVVQRIGIVLGRPATFTVKHGLFTPCLTTPKSDLHLVTYRYGLAHVLPTTQAVQEDRTSQSGSLSFVNASAARDVDPYAHRTYFQPRVISPCRAASFLKLHAPLLQDSVVPTQGG